MRNLLLPWLFLLAGLPAWTAPAITEILGRTTDHSITVNARADAALELYFEYGLTPGGYTAQTAKATPTVNTPVELVMDGLRPNTRYYYRIRHRNAASSEAFKGHDHLFVRRQRDGVTYQELPEPADASHTLWNGDAYTSGDQFSNTGYVRVTVSPACVFVEYVRTFLPRDEKPPAQFTGMVQFSYSIPAGGTVNGASFRAPVTAGSIASVFGANLAPSSAAADKLPLPTTLGGVSVSMNGFVAPLFFVSPQQINLQVPWQLQGLSQASLTVSVNGVAGAQQTVGLAGSNPGLFTIDSAGRGAVLIASTGELAAVSGSVPGRLARPVKRGEYISIFCTGLGAVGNPPANGAPPSGNPLSATITSPAVTIGGVPSPVTFSGLSPEFAGVYQVNVQVPANAPAGDALPVVLSVDGAPSNTVTIAVQ